MDVGFSYLAFRVFYAAAIRQLITPVLVIVDATAPQLKIQIFIY